MTMIHTSIAPVQTVHPVARALQLITKVAALIARMRPAPFRPLTPYPGPDRFELSSDAVHDLSVRGGLRAGQW